MGGHEDGIVSFGVSAGEAGSIVLQTLAAASAASRVQESLNNPEKEQDIVSGIEIGADDYITKPFSPRVLVDRARAVSRRGMRTEPVEKAMGKPRNMRMSMDPNINIVIHSILSSITAVPSLLQPSGDRE